MPSYNESLTADTSISRICTDCERTELLHAAVSTGPWLFMVLEDVVICVCKSTPEGDPVPTRTRFSRRFDRGELELLVRVPAPAYDRACSHIERVGCCFRAFASQAGTFL